MEDATLIDRSALLLAVLKAEYQDDDGDYRRLCHSLFEQQDRLDNLAQLLDNWYAEHAKTVRELFGFVEALRPGQVTDMASDGDVVLLEITLAPLTAIKG